jgi:hypothetical protein
MVPCPILDNTLPALADDGAAFTEFDVINVLILRARIRNVFARQLEHAGRQMGRMFSCHPRWNKHSSPVVTVEVYR